MSLIRSLCLALLPLGLQAQGIPLKTFQRNIWLDPRSLLTIPGSPAHASGPALLEEVGRPGGARRLPRPPRVDEKGEHTLSWGMGVQAAGPDIYFLNQVMRDLPLEPGQRRPKRSSHYEFFRFDRAAWRWETEPSATLDWAKGLQLELLSSERVLAIATSPESLVKDRRAYPFAVFRKGDSGTFDLEKFLEVGLEQPAIQPDGQWTYPWMQSLWLSRKVAHAGDRLALATGFGLVWLFDAKGELRRLVRLYDALTEARLRKGDLWGDCVLGLQPKADGEFLVSALDGEALQRGHLLGEQAPPATDGKGYLDRQNTILDRLLSLAPRVDWIVINPWEGKPRPEVPPRGLPSAIRSAAALEDFNWVFQVDGNLRVFTHAESQRRDPKAPKTMLDLLAMPAIPPAPGPIPPRGS